VGGVIVHHQVEVLLRVGLGDLLQEREELLLALPGFRRGSDLPGRDVQRGEQDGGSVPHVVVGGFLR